MVQSTKPVRLELTLFDEAGGVVAANADARAAVAASESKRGAVKQTAATGTGLDGGRTNRGEDARATDEPSKSSLPAENRAAFERLIKGDYRDAFAERMQRIIDDRFKGTKGLQERMDALKPVLEKLAAHYGVGADDPTTLLKAMESGDIALTQGSETTTRDERLELEGRARGMTVEQLGEAQRIEQARAQQVNRVQQHQREAMSRKYGDWIRQGGALREMYPQFDLAAESANSRTGRQFLSLLRNNVPMRTAYEVIHRDEILGGAMQYTAQQVQKKTVEDIRARGLRPEENGARGQSAAQVKKDIHGLTRAERAEIARRVARGERVTF